LLAAAALVTGAAPSAEGRIAAGPSLKLMTRDPLQVQGLRFKVAQRVRVTATSASTEKSITRVVRTSARGTFTARLGHWNRCTAVIIKASGARGDRARLVIQPPPPIDGPCWGL
jgi:hypothetical protein